MRRGALALLLLLSAAPVGAQNFQVRTAAAAVGLETPAVSSATPDEMVARLMSFDRNGDGRLAKDELAERMETLFESADTSEDGTLDEGEVRAIAERPVAQSVVRGFQAGRYGFGDESGPSSRLHIEGALADLKLPDAVFDDAYAILSTFLDDLDAKARAELLKDMAGVLPEAQMAKLETAFGPGTQVRSILFTGPNAPGMLVVVGNGRVGVGVSFQGNQKQPAIAAIEKFTRRQRVAEDADRAVLLEQLRDVLTGEQRDDFRAALARRPIAKTGPSGDTGPQPIGPITIF